MSTWDCRAKNCQSRGYHRLQEDCCLGGNWSCRRIQPPCPGHRDPKDQCPSGTLWDCRAKYCQSRGYHSRPEDCCPGGNWPCRRKQPPCPGHSHPAHQCVDYDEVCRGPHFVKGPHTSLVGSKFAAAGLLWRQEILCYGSSTVALKNYSGLKVVLNNPAVAKLVVWYYKDRNEDLMYVDLVALAPGDANLEARRDGAVVTFIQVHISPSADANATYVDDFSNAYYNLGFWRDGGNLSKWLVLE